MIDEGQSVDEEPFTRTGDRLRRLRNRRVGGQKDSNQCYRTKGLHHRRILDDPRAFAEIAIVAKGLCRMDFMRPLTLFRERKSSRNARIAVGFLSMSAMGGKRTGICITPGDP
jgi:hypothetical protein